ncbi:hypothetical protein [Ruegeria lacuscaerulensis]|uniref:hypothetical protein n=1 Tax=Ruegeria lacuscaerulensis TaxID=55218 RepID=UPI00147F9293|nr:hypothetical protein [Ruegeria lacuscaerulensis]
MTQSDYRVIPAQTNETSKEYAGRLQDMGFEEMFIRKALRYHFDIDTEQLPSFFEDFETARLRHISLIQRLKPQRTKRSMIMKIAKNLGCSDESAELWFERFQEQSEDR